MNSINTHLFCLMLLAGLAGSGLTYAQSPGSLYVNAGPDQTISCGGDGCVDLTATFLETYETDGAEYTVTSINYEPPFAFNGLANQLNPNIDDAWSAVDQLPFDFCYFGNLVEEFQVGSNGVLRFDVNPSDTGSGSNAWQFDQNLPNNTQPALGEANVLLPVHDIDPSVGSTEQIGYEVLGTYPNRVLVVSYYNVPYFSCNSLKATHMAVFYEFSNIIDVYIQDKPVCSGWNGGRAAIGIQNNAGTIAYVPPGRNTSNSPWTANDEAWRFAPIGEETFEFSWWDNDGNLISTDATINVCEPGTYIAQVVYTNTCNNETYIVTDEVVVTNSQPFEINIGDDVETCELEEIILDASDGAPTGAIYEWFYNGVSQGAPSAANPTYTVTAPNSGTYKVEVTDPTDPTCVVTDEVEIDFADTFVPEFTIQDTYCIGDSADPLPGTSGNGYTGTWFPTTINTGTVGTFTYEFTPDEGQCAEPIEITITITPREIPEFPAIDPLCIGIEPPVLNATSDNGITGTWVPAVINTDEEGEFEYHFYPNDGFCAEELIITVVIANALMAEFYIQDQYCQGADPDDLPLTSDNGIPGTWFPAVIDTSTPGITTYTFTPDDSECVAGIEIQIEITTGVELNQLNNIPICDDDMDGTWNYNLTTLNSQLISPTTGITFSYYTSLTNAQNDNPIPSSQWTNYSFTTLPASIWVIATTADGCRSEEIEIQFIAGQEVQHDDGPYEIEYCEGAALDLTQFEADMALESGISFSYYETLANAENESNPLMNEDAYVVAGDGTIYVRLEKTGRCAIILEIDYELRPSPSIDGLEPLQRVICDGDTIEIEALSDDTSATFLWEWGNNQSQAGPDISITAPGIYTLTVTGDNGCESTEQVVVTSAAQPTITSVESGTNYLIVYVQSGGGVLEYSLNGVIWQSSPRFDNLVKGEMYTVYVREDGCMIDTHKVLILDVSNFVSPNGDGYNDVWEVRGIEVTPKATIKIFDRYGKIFVDTNFDGNYVWDGKYMGSSLPSGDYWYIMDIPSDGVVVAKKFVGHVSIRN